MRIYCFFLSLLALVGCHRVLDVGSGDPDGGVVGDTALHDASNPQPLWYQRDEAYIGDELRLPVPASMTLQRDVAEARTIPISIVPGPDESLLVAQGNRVHSFAWSAEGVRVQTPPGGVRVTTEGNVVLVPHRRIALTDQGDSWGSEFSGSPHWSATALVRPNFHLAQAPQLPQVNDFSAATSAQNDSLVFSSAHDVRGTGLFVSRTSVTTNTAFITSPVPEVRGWSAGQFYRSPHQVLSDGNRFLLARIWRTDSAARIAIDEYTNTGPTYWRNLISNYASGGDSNNWFQAAIGRGHVLTVFGAMPTYGHRGVARYQLARIESEPEFLGSSFSFDEVNAGSVAAVAWDESQNSFVVAMGVHADELYTLPRAPLLHTAFFRVALDGTRVHIGDVPLQNVSLAPWRGEVWGAGVDAQGQLRVFSATTFAGNALGVGAHLAGPQQLHGMILLEGAPLLLWADGARQAALTRLDLAAGVSAESRLLAPQDSADTPTSAPRFLRDGHADFVGSSVADGGVLVALDRAGSSAWRRVFRLRESSPNTRIPMWPLHMHAGRVIWRSLYLSGQFSSETSAFDYRSGAQIWLGGVTNAALQCAGTLCVEDTRNAGGSPFPPIAIMLDDEIALRSYAESDTDTFAGCVNPSGATSFDAPLSTTVRDGKPLLARDRATGHCLDTVIPFADSRVRYVCAPTATPGETCGDIVANVHTDNHTLLAETRLSLNAATKLELRLYTRDGSNLVRTLTLPLARDEQTGAGRELMRASTRLLHVQGGLFLLAYSRVGATGVAESFVRVVYFPEAETIVQ